MGRSLNNSSIPLFTHLFSSIHPCVCLLACSFCFWFTFSDMLFTCVWQGNQLFVCCDCGEYSAIFVQFLLTLSIFNLFYGILFIICVFPYFQALCDYLSSEDHRHLDFVEKQVSWYYIFLNIPPHPHHGIFMPPSDMPNLIPRIILCGSF